MLGGDLRFDAAPGAEIAGDNDLALHVDAHSGQALVVGRYAVVYVDELTGNVAVGGVGVVHRQTIGPRRGLVAFHGRLGEARDVMLGRNHFEDARLGRREERIKCLDLSLVAPALEQRSDFLGNQLATRRADMMRARTEILQPAIHILAAERRVELLLQLELFSSRSCVEAGQRWSGRLCSDKSSRKKQGYCRFREHFADFIESIT